MLNEMKDKISHSMEFDLDREIEELIAKMVEGELTSAEAERFVALQNRRVQLMRPALKRRNMRVQTFRATA